MSLNAISGADHSRTIRVGALMLILIDSGSSHSFVDATSVERLGSKVKKNQIHCCQGGQLRNIVM